MASPSSLIYLDSQDGDDDDDDDNDDDDDVDHYKLYHHHRHHLKHEVFCGWEPLSKLHQNPNSSTDSHHPPPYLYTSSLSSS